MRCERSRSKEKDSVTTFQQDRDVQDEDAPAGLTGAAGAGDARKGPHRVLVVLLVTWRNQPGGCSYTEGTDSSRDGRAARELPGVLWSWDWLSCQRWVPAVTHNSDCPKSFSKPGAAPGTGAPLHWCLLVSWLVLQWVGEIRLLHPQHWHGDGDRHHQGCWSRTPIHHLNMP